MNPRFPEPGTAVVTAVSIKDGLRTADNGLRTGYKTRTRYKTRTAYYVYKNSLKVTLRETESGLA